MSVRVGISLSPALRFLSKQIADKYDLSIPQYEGVDQIAEVPSDEQRL